MESSDALAYRYGLTAQEVATIEADLRQRGLHQVPSYGAWLRTEMLKAAGRKLAAKAHDASSAPFPLFTARAPVPAGTVQATPRRLLRRPRPGRAVQASAGGHA